MKSSLKNNKNWLKNWFIPFKGNDYRPKFLENRTVLYVAVFLMFLKILSLIFFFPLPENIFFADITKIDLVNLLNLSRVENGLGRLSESPVLDKAAGMKAKDMIANNYFAHQSPQGISPWFWFRQAGYNYKYAGENLAVGFFDSKNVFEAWMDSKTHKENILNPNYKEVGTAVVRGFGGNSGTIIAVQMFGSLQPGKAKAAPVIASKSPTPKQAQIAAKASPIPKPIIAAVLSEETSAPLLVQDNGGYKKNNYLKFINFIIYDYSRLYNYAIYLALFFTVFASLLNVFVNIRIQRKDVIFRSVVLISIIVGAIVVNQSLIMNIIGFSIEI